MSALIQTLFDIMRLRKGPDALPYSQLLLYVVVALWLGSDLLSTALLPNESLDRLFEGWATALVGLFIYLLVIGIHGRSARLVQMMTALLGCGVIFGVILTVIIALHLQLAAAEVDGVLPLLIFTTAWSIIAWSIVVDGHILSTTIEQPRFVGVLIAFSVFLVQVSLRLVVFAAPDVAAGAG